MESNYKVIYLPSQAVQIDVEVFCYLFGKTEQWMVTQMLPAHSYDTNPHSLSPQVMIHVRLHTGRIGHPGNHAP